LYAGELICVNRKAQAQDPEPQPGSTA
jgi:hypothetical protein